MNNATPLKEAELRQLARCASCDKLIGETGSPFFFKVTLEAHLLNTAAVQRQIRLLSMLGGSARLAAAMGADEDMTITTCPFQTVMICQSCAFGEVSLAEILDRANTRAQTTSPTPAP